MSKKQDVIIKNYKKKTSLIKKHNVHYHSEDSPKITDSAYDNLKREVLELEKKFSFLFFGIL